MAGTVAMLTPIRAREPRLDIFPGPTHPVALVHPALPVPGLPRPLPVWDIAPQLPAVDSLVYQRLHLPVIRPAAARSRMLALVVEAAVAV